MKRILSRLFALALLVASTTAACSDETTISLCDCEIGEYCVDDECRPTKSNIAPAPEETRNTP